MDPIVANMRPIQKNVQKSIAQGVKATTTPQLRVGGLQAGVGSWRPPTGSTIITGPPTGAPPRSGSKVNVPQVIGTLGPTACEYIQDPILRDICKAGTTLIGGTGTQPPGGTNLPVNQPIPTSGGPGCPQGKIEIGGRCVDPSAVLPGGQPFISPGPSQAVQGAFGMPAIVPEYEQRVVRNCPEGMVLGRDDLCYPKQVLPRRSKYRKWRPGRKPLFTGGDLAAIRRAERLKSKAKRIGKDLGLKVSNR